MLKYILIRLVLIIVTFSIIITMLFMATRVAHLNVWTYFDFWTNVRIAWQEYMLYLGNIFRHWDWGTSEDGVPLTEIMRLRMPLTLRINLVSLLLYVPIGLTLGIVAALKKDTWIDQVISFFTLVFTSVPSYIMIFALIYFFSYNLEWLPAIYPHGIGGPFSLSGFIIPFIALSITPIALFTRHARGEFIEVVQSDFFLLLRTKGMRKHQTIFRHGLKNIIIPILPEVNNVFVLVMSGSFFIEKVYNMPGISSLFFDSMAKPVVDTFHVSIHTPTAVIVSVFYMTLTVSIGLIIDILYMLLDPRIKIGSKRTG